MGCHLHLIDLLAKLYRKQLANVNVAETIRTGCQFQLRNESIKVMLVPYLFNILAEMVIRETRWISTWTTKFNNGGRMITNLRSADDIILLATSETELQEMLDRLDRVSRKYSLLINIDKTNVMASDGIAYRILIQNEQLAQVNTFPYLGSPIAEDGECTAEFHTRLNRGQAIGASLQKIRKSHSIPISTKTRLIKALVWPLTTYGCESWTLRKNEETRLEAYEMKGLRKILRVSCTAKIRTEWVFNKTVLKSKLLHTVKARKLAYYGYTMRKQGNCLKE